MHNYTHFLSCIYTTLIFFNGKESRNTLARDNCAKQEMQPTSVWRCSFLGPPKVLLGVYLSLGPSMPKKLKSCSAVLPSYLGLYSHSGRTFMTYILCCEFCKPETVLGYEPHWHLRDLPVFPRWRTGLVTAQTHGRDGGSRGLAARPLPSPALSLRLEVLAASLLRDIVTNPFPHIVHT